MKKSAHKSLPDSEWFKRLRKFADTGIWPSEMGSRPSKRSSKWLKMYDEINVCQMQPTNMAQPRLGAVKSKSTCTCSFHNSKVSLAVQEDAPGCAKVSPSLTHNVLNSSLTHNVQLKAQTSQEKSQAVQEDAPDCAKVSPSLTHNVLNSSLTHNVQLKAQTSQEKLPKIRPPMKLYDVKKSHFGGALSRAAIPNITGARKKPSVPSLPPSTSTDLTGSDVEECCDGRYVLTNKSLYSGNLSTVSVDSAEAAWEFSQMSHPDLGLSEFNPSEMGWVKRRKVSASATCDTQADFSSEDDSWLFAVPDNTTLQSLAVQEDAPGCAKVSPSLTHNVLNSSLTHNVQLKAQTSQEKSLAVQEDAPGCAKVSPSLTHNVLNSSLTHNVQLKAQTSQEKSLAVQEDAPGCAKVSPSLTHNVLNSSLTHNVQLKAQTSQEKVNSTAGKSTKQAGSNDSELECLPWDCVVGCSDPGLISAVINGQCTCYLPILLPKEWKNKIPAYDQRWISKSLFDVTSTPEKLVLKARLDLWHYPPQPSLLCNLPPKPDHYFAHKLLVWMPYKQWQVKLVCKEPGCKERQLTGGGIYKRVRMTLDTDSYYIMVSEVVVCNSCKMRTPSWSNIVLPQLDVGHRRLFPVILTRKSSCDLRVARIMRERTLGNSSTRLANIIREQHSEERLNRCARYLTDAAQFVGKPGVPAFQPPPPPMDLPTYKWFLRVYVLDVLTRIDEIKAGITSSFGNILKMDSTKKITKKLSGNAKGTALWCTNVGNEHGQVLNSVMTAGEGEGLKELADGLMRRYNSATNISPPAIMYVDSRCCAKQSQGSIKQLFAKSWPNIEICLDIFHFIFRFAAGCTTDAHQLYGTFMGRLSSCIFEWDPEDVDQLMMAKRAELSASGRKHVSATDVRQSLKKQELALHCRRTTRGVKKTAELIEGLLRQLDGDGGRDSLGVPLFHHTKIWKVWADQKIHLPCIQDRQNVQLYTQTGTLRKCGVVLKTYRCARGSSSLESFHLHLNRFIPGTSANDLHFQAYLIDGLSRWNADRAAAALGRPKLQSYSGELISAVQKLSCTVLNREHIPGLQNPGKYTGELIGMEYLYNQTGKALQSSEDLEDSDDEALDGDEPLDEGIHQDISDPIDNLVSIENTLNLPESEVVTPTHESEVVTPTRESEVVTPTRESEVVTPTRENEVVTSTRENEVVTSAHVHEEDSVDFMNRPGYDHVDKLAEYLVELRHTVGHSLTNVQATRICDLWDALDPFDQQKIVYAQRKQRTTNTGMFKATKVRGGVPPSVEDTKRIALGRQGVPAQYPDCCRVVEQLCIKLCLVYPSPQKTKTGKTEARWTLIIRAYKKIRELVTNNAKVMTLTALQLVMLNNATLSKWHGDKLKREDRTVLLQGVNLPPSLTIAAEPLPSAAVKRTIEHSEEKHEYRHPENTAQQARVRRRLEPSLHDAQELQPASAPVFLQPQQLILPYPGMQLMQQPQQLLLPYPGMQLMQGSQSGYVVIPSNQPLQHVQPAPQPQSMSKTSVWRRKKSEGTQEKRPYNRKQAHNFCKLCKEPFSKSSGHTQYYGYNYCPSSGKPLAEWLAEKKLLYVPNKK